MGSEMEKVYVAIGDDPREGFSTLEWALRKWSSHSISVVILYAFNNSSSGDYLYPPFGKLPTSYVSDEKMGVLKKMKEGESDNLLSEYKAFCGKVKVEIIKFEKHDEPFHKLLVELMSGLGITKLVMDITCIKYSAWKYKGVSSGLFYVHNHKPDFCELFVIYRGKLVFLKEEHDQGTVEDIDGLIVAKFKENGSSSFKGWLGKKLLGNTTNDKQFPNPPSSSSNNDSENRWEDDVEEIENYFRQLLSLNSSEEDSKVEKETLVDSPAEPDNQENMSVADNTEMLKAKITKTRDFIQLMRKEAKVNIERCAKSEWAISLCTRRAEELEAQIKKEIASKVDRDKDLEAAKEEIYEIRREVEDKSRKVESMLELQHELSNKLQFSSLTKSHAEAQLEKAIIMRAEMVREIEELREQRDVFQRRIQFCKEKDAIGMGSGVGDLKFGYKAFTVDEIRMATDNFAERLRFKSTGGWANVYRGRIEYATVAIKIYDSGNGLTQEALQAKVKLLAQIRHPNLVAVLGFCSELNCIVYEYMHNGCLRDALFSSHGSRIMGLNWYARICIAAQVSAGLSFLHSTQPRPIVHGNLNASTILLDRHFVAKINIVQHNCPSELYSDIWAFGNVVMQLLTGRNRDRLVGEAVVKDQKALAAILDEKAGLWPLDLAVELAEIGMRCISVNEGEDPRSMMAIVVRLIDRVRKRANDRMEMGDCDVSVEGDADIEDPSHVPSVFLCPIFKDVMKNPHIAADGYSYELEAIKEWFRTEHNTSPMTNLRLNHKHLIPNMTLRSLIHDWHVKRSIPLT